MVGASCLLGQLVWHGSSHIQALAAGLSKPADFDPPLGRYQYKIQWANAEVAEAFVTIRREEEFYRISVDTRTTKGIEYIYSVRYRGEGIINADDYEAVKTVLVNKTKSREIRTEIEYHQGGDIEATKVKKRRKKPDKIKVRKLEADAGVVDVFTAVFLARSFDWHVGLYEEFDVYTGGKQPYRVTLNCVGVIELMHRDKEVSCWVIVPTFANLSKPDKKTKISSSQIYLSTDPSRDILKINAQTVVGTVRAKMVSFEPQ